MKKLKVIFLLCTMSLMLAACGSKSDNDDYDDDDEREEESTDDEDDDEDDEDDSETETNDEGSDDTQKDGNGDSTSKSSRESLADYSLNNVNTSFSDGLVWAEVYNDLGQWENVLINNDLTVVYELADGETKGDLYDGMALITNTDQTNNPGFKVIDDSGEILYEGTDMLCSYSSSPVISITDDGCIIYERKESGLSVNTTYVCILNDKFEKIFEVEKPKDGTYNIDIADYLYLANGYYVGLRYSSGTCYSTYTAILLDTKTNNIVTLNNETRDPSYWKLEWAIDNDKCVGIIAYDKSNYYYVSADTVDFSLIGSTWDLTVQAQNKGYMSSGNEGSEGIFYAYENHRFYSYDKEKLNGQWNYVSVDGISLPDYQVAISEYRVSADLNYIAINMRGADSNYYVTVCDRNGNSLYEPIVSNVTFDYCIVVDGYIITTSGDVITSSGEKAKLGDGNDLSGIGSEAINYYTKNSGCKLAVTYGYIYYSNYLYNLDGSKVETVLGPSRTKQLEEENAAKEEASKEQESREEAKRERKDRENKNKDDESETSTESSGLRIGKN